MGEHKLTKRKRHPPCQIVIDENAEGTGTDIFIVFDGVRIAKRGHPDTPQAGTWVMLEPGYAVYWTDKEVWIERGGVKVQ